MWCRIVETTFFNNSIEKQSLQSLVEHRARYKVNLGVHVIADLKPLAPWHLHIAVIVPCFETDTEHLEMELNNELNHPMFT